LGFEHASPEEAIGYRTASLSLLVRRVVDNTPSKVLLDGLTISQIGATSPLPKGSHTNPIRDCCSSGQWDEASVP